MKTAYSVWQGRIAPVFDVSCTIIVRETERNDLVSEKKINLPEETVYGKASVLTGNGVSVLVCGAVSREAAAVLEGAGIQLIPFVSGDIGEVIDAFEKNRIGENRFRMPGCGRHGRCRGMAATNADMPGCRRVNKYRQGG